MTTKLFSTLFVLFVKVRSTVCEGCEISTTLTLVATGASFAFDLFFLWRFETPWLAAIVWRVWSASRTRIPITVDVSGIHLRGLLWIELLLLHGRQRLCRRSVQVPPSEIPVQRAGIPSNDNGGNFNDDDDADSHGDDEDCDGVGGKMIDQQSSLSKRKTPRSCIGFCAMSYGFNCFCGKDPLVKIHVNAEPDPARFSVLVFRTSHQETSCSHHVFAVCFSSVNPSRPVKLSVKEKDLVCFV